jgi:hypothetical protein
MMAIQTGKYIGCLDVVAVEGGWRRDGIVRGVEVGVHKQQAP